MSVKNQRRECGYCGESKKLTDDHVPPKLLLEKPYPPNLITVPACRSCNESFMKDDEYTRTVLALDYRASKNIAAQQTLQSVIRSLKRPNARGFAEYLAAQATFTKILGPTGAPMGREIRPDKKRVNNTGAHIIRGLYFEQTGRPILKNAAFKVECKAGLTATHPDIQTIARALTQFPNRRNGESGKAFSYVAAFAEGMSVWLLLLYDFFFWLGTIDERDPSALELDDLELRKLLASN